MAGVDATDRYEIACFFCGRPFRVCVADFRGQRYCLGGDCRKLGYRARTRERGRRYQGKHQGRQNHRDRQQSLRNKQQGPGEPKGSGSTPVADQADPEGTGCRPRDPDDVTHSTAGEAAAATVTVCPTADRAPAEEARRGGRPGFERDEGQRRSGAGRAAMPRLFRCALCNRAGFVVFRFSNKHPAGVRVFRSHGP